MIEEEELRQAVEDKKNPESNMSSVLSNFVFLGRIGCRVSKVYVLEMMVDSR